MQEEDKHFLWLMIEDVYLRHETPECHWLRGLYQVIFNKRLPQLIWGVHFYNCLGIKMCCWKGFTFGICCKWSHFVSAGPWQCSTPRWLAWLAWLLWSQPEEQKQFRFLQTTLNCVALTHPLLLGKGDLLGRVLVPTWAIWLTLIKSRQLTSCALTIKSECASAEAGQIQSIFLLNNITEIVRSFLALQPDK